MPNAIVSSTAYTISHKTNLIIRQKFVNSKSEKWNEGNVSIAFAIKWYIFDCFFIY